jgi:chromate reductase
LVKVRLLGISGSLRNKSSNTALLQAAALVAPTGLEVAQYGGLGALPPFNPDLDGEVVPASVADFRAQVTAADGLLISTPEYAHGVPGVLKNALDWLVGDVNFYGKPVALFNASRRTTYAQVSIVETLATMSATLVADAFVTISLLGSSIDARTIASDAELADPIRAALATFARAIEERRANPVA